jgi:2-hydroxychromene-2-carboxylate isomerase
MHDSLFAYQGRLEDPHLWERASALGINLELFDRDRRSHAVQDRVRRDFQSGVRAGVVTTPTVFAAGQMHAGRVRDDVLDALITR